ncbi:hypothetical protein BKA70DRAFT_1572158 [Coprinopsis sp. MPI-PUGE-AT-0042]|nr:hypothetical protein BKA70DRAFT_1572158 [Coprinopsis sp. MPI-PUGE-AT-0042]
MPEGRESVATAKVANMSLEYYKDSPNDVETLMADASTKCKDEQGNHIATDGMVFALDNTCRLLRGTFKNQSFLLGKALQKTEENPNPIPITSLKLKGVQFLVRALIVDLDRIFLRLAYLTHTSVQVYSREQWDTTITKVSKKNRRFHVALGIVTRDYVLAFLSMDLLFQPCWNTSLYELGPFPPYIYTEWAAFLEVMGIWLEEQLQKPSCGSISAVMRENPWIFPGVGGYTVSEVAVMAGFSPYEIARAVIFCPSRFARLCEAIWVYTHKSETELDSILRPCWHQGVLAPTEAQRLKYSQHMIIWGKPAVMYPKRVVSLANTYNDAIASIETKMKGQRWYRVDHSDVLYDPFEPAFIRPSFEVEGHEYYLGHLIFGDEAWKIIQGQAGFPMCAPDTPVDPLTRAYRSRPEYNYLEGPTFLDLDLYKNELFTDMAKGNRRKIKTFAYKGTEKVPMFSIIECYPPNSRFSPQFKNTVTLKPVDPQSASFKEMISENAVAYGPLEYCSSGKPIEVKASKKRKKVSNVLTVRGFEDPRISQVLSAHDVKRQLSKRLREEWYNELEQKAKKTGKEEDIKAWKRARHRAMTDDEKKRIEKKANKIIAATPHLQDLLGEYSLLSDSDDDEPPAKRVSMSRDLKFALSNQENVDLPPRRLRSSI